MYKIITVQEKIEIVLNYIEAIEAAIKSFEENYSVIYEKPGIEEELNSYKTKKNVLLSILDELRLSNIEKVLTNQG